MCGICGVFGSVDANVVRTMASRISHRGPDDDGFFFDRDIGLGHRRLSIIDLDGGRQPIFNEDGSAVIVFNGEIYNFKDIKADLELKGHLFATNTDTEAIVHAYEEYGFECVSRLNGMFAFAIWDSKKKLLFIARDRLGIKPVYYSKTKDGFVFASEIKSLLEHPEVSREINKSAFYEFVNLQYSVAPNTIFSSVKKLSPGSYMVIDKKGIKQANYWSLKYSPVSKSKDYFRKHIRGLLEDAVSKRLMSEVPLGSFLSGGIDSSIVVGLMTKLKEEPVKTFSIGFTDRKFDETYYSTLVSERFGTDHREFIVDHDMLKHLPKISYFLDEPLADAAAIPTYILSREAVRKVKVVLTGEGGDENFAGYPYYKYFKFASSVSAMTPKAMFRGWPGKASHAVISKALGLKYGSLWSDIESRESLFKRKIFGFENNSLLLNYNMLPVRADTEMVSKIVNPFFKKGSFINNMQSWDVRVWLPDDLLMKVDKTTMANSLEARVPFLDHRFVEFAATVPANRRFSYFSDKALLKQSFRDILPREILKRKKTGFSVPIESWFSNQYKKDVVGLFSENREFMKDYFKIDFLMKNIRENKNPVLTWRATNFLFWYKNYIE